MRCRTANVVVLLFGCGAIAFQAIRRFDDPAPVGGIRGRKGDLKIKGAFLHTTETTLTAPLVHDGGENRAACMEVCEHLGIGHATFQVKTAEQAEACELRPAQVV